MDYKGAKLQNIHFFDGKIHLQLKYFVYNTMIICNFIKGVICREQ